MASINLIDDVCSSEFVNTYNISEDNSYSLNLTHIVNKENDYENESQTIINESKYYDLNDLILVKDMLKNTFNILSLNIESINAKWDLFQATIEFLESYGINFSAITIQETWLDEDPKIHELNNFTSFDQPRTCSQHGGLKTFIRKNYFSKKLNIYKKSDL